MDQANNTDSRVDSRSSGGTLDTVRVAAVQMDVALGEVIANLGVVMARLQEAAAQGAQLVVFPECALTGYGFPEDRLQLRQAGFARHLVKPVEPEALHLELSAVQRAPN